MLADALEDPSAYSPNIVSSHTLDLESLLPLTYPLFHLVAHPNTSPGLANNMLQTLTTLLRGNSRSGFSDTDLELYMVAESLYKMGAKRTAIPKGLQETADLDSVRSGMTDKAKIPFTQAGRDAATVLLLEVVNVLVQTG